MASDIYRPHPRTDNGRYHFTANRNGRIVPVGYCAMGCRGHEKPSAAIFHYLEWLLDRRLELDVRLKPGVPCRACGKETTGAARVPEWGEWPLCEYHRNPEVVEQYLILEINPVVE